MIHDSAHSGHQIRRRLMNLKPKHLVSVVLSSLLAVSPLRGLLGSLGLLLALLLVLTKLLDRGLVRLLLLRLLALSSGKPRP